MARLSFGIIFNGAIKYPKHTAKSFHSEHTIYCRFVFKAELITLFNIFKKKRVLIGCIFNAIKSVKLVKSLFFLLGLIPLALTIWLQVSVIDLLLMVVLHV